MISNGTTNTVAVSIGNVWVTVPPGGSVVVPVVVGDVVQVGGMTATNDTGTAGWLVAESGGGVQLVEVPHPWWWAPEGACGAAFGAGAVCLWGALFWANVWGRIKGGVSMIDV